MENVLFNAGGPNAVTVLPDRGLSVLATRLRMPDACAGITSALSAQRAVSEMVVVRRGVFISVSYGQKNVKRVNAQPALIVNAKTSGEITNAESKNFSVLFGERQQPMRGGKSAE
jgi:hypothetical protein